MTMAAYDVDGYVGEATTVHGWFLFGGWCRRQTPNVVQEFGRNAYTEEPMVLAEALAQLKCRTNANNKIRLGLIALARKARMVLIISERSNSAAMQTEPHQKMA